MEKRFDKILVFDVWADYAHFRKFYTTTSPLTFSVPPRTALCGLIGAISGLGKEENEYLNYFSLDEAFISLRVLTPIKKTGIAQNLIHTKDAKGAGMNLIKTRTQILFEYLKSPKFRVYFGYAGNNEKLLRLENLLKAHKSVYTPVLGLSENLAGFEFVGNYDYEIKKSEDFVSVSSVVPMEKISDNEIDFDYEAEYFTERQPLALTPERVVVKYDDLLFERNGKPVRVKLKSEFFELNNTEREKIVFIE